MKKKLNKYQPIIRLKKEWVDPEDERRIMIPIEITYEGDTVTIKKTAKEAK